MKTLSDLINNNRAWAAKIVESDPQFFTRLSQQQSPEYLWIGCSDSRVPANQIVGKLPGEIFVHRNVANLVIHTDLNCLSTIHFAVAALKVKHIIVCGHYGCGGVRAALEDQRLGLIDNWLRHIQDVGHKHAAILGATQIAEQRLGRLCELNVIEQVVNVCQTTVVQEAWSRGQELTVHGWIYGIDNGLIKDLSFCVSKPSELSGAYKSALAALDRKN